MQIISLDTAAETWLGHSIVHSWQDFTQRKGIFLKALHGLVYSCVCVCGKLHCCHSERLIEIIINISCLCLFITLL